jgi:uncharacterized protein Yka (UPF0111/DUF47 family)
MEDAKFNELKDLILGLDRKVDAGLGNLDRKIEVNHTELKGEIRRLEEKIDGIESKLETKIDGIGKRLDQQEFISRGAVVALIGGSGAGLVKYLFFS